MSKLKSHVYAICAISILILGVWGLIALGRTGAAIALALILLIAFGGLYAGLYCAFREWRPKQ